jgi:hypothetical protein
MNNPNFMPLMLKEKYETRNMKVYKAVSVLLWVVFLVSFLYGIFNYNKYRDLSEKLKQQNMSKSFISEKAYSKNVQSISSFKKFIEYFEDDILHRNVEISDRQIYLLFTVKDEEELIKIADFVENNIGYKILSLSPVNDENYRNSFEIIIEVT